MIYVTVYNLYLESHSMTEKIKVRSSILVTFLVVVERYNQAIMFDAYN